MIIPPDKRLSAFRRFGALLRDYSFGAHNMSPLVEIIDEGVQMAVAHNPWFTETNVELAINSIGRMLDTAELGRWAGGYNLYQSNENMILTVGVIMAGNIPAVGFHDLLCVLMAGCKAVVKLSSEDMFLIPAIVNVLQKIEAGFGKMVSFDPLALELADAIIATGSDNTARYFDFHYGRKPHIFRKNRNGIAVLDGNESIDQLNRLAIDVFQYFGLGCRNVSKIFVPVNYHFQFLQSAFEKHQGVRHHKPYMNNYTMQKALLKMQKADIMDNGFLLLTPSHSISSGIAVLNFAYYSDLSSLNDEISLNEYKIQCIVSSMELSRRTINFGEAQQPALNDYADGIDTMKFLLNLYDNLG